MKKYFVILCALFYSVSCVNSKEIMGGGDGASEAKSIQPTYANVKYGPHDRNVMDVYLSKSSAACPVVIYIHGGGFIQGDKKLQGNMVRFVQEFNKRGVTFVSINYPYLSSNSLDQILKDIARSVQFLRYESKKYNIQKDKIAVFGNSAGAGSSLWINFHDDLKNSQSSDPVERESSKPVCAAAISTQATYLLSEWGEILDMPQASVEQALSKKEMFPYFEKHMNAMNAQEKTVYYKEVDILSWVDKKDAPVFLLNIQKPGKKANLLHHPKHSEAVEKKCQEKGVSVDYFSPQDGKPIQGQKALFEFLIKNLK